MKEPNTPKDHGPSAVALKRAIATYRGPAWLFHAWLQCVSRRQN